MKHTYYHFLLIVSLILAPFVLFLPTRQKAALPNPGDMQSPSRLPIFRVSTNPIDPKFIQRNATGILGITAPAKRVGSRLISRQGPKVLDVDTRSGAIWLADESQMWNPKLKPSLPGEDRARSIANDFLKKHSLLPLSDRDQYSKTSFANVGGTQAAFYDPTSKKRSDQKLDVQVNYTVKLNIPELGNEVSVVGGGGEFNVTIGDRGSVIGFHGLWRPIDAVETESPVIPQDQADAQFKELTKGLEIRSVKSYIAYYSAPPSVEQKFLYPVYVYRATAYINTREVPLRILTIPATEFGPKRPEPKPLKARPANARPTRRSTMPEGPEERGVKRDYAHATLQSSWKEAGSSFIGVSGGLGGSQGNVQGFVNNLSADGWNINFVWGDGDAWESDWRRNDDDWVDAADFVFYTGHADMNGWALSSPDDGSLVFSEVGGGPQNPGDIWGRQDLEWVIVAACGPLQDQVISNGGGDVFARWDGAFDGLHQLLGYGAITFDNEEEGDRVTDFARSGDTVINSWFRAAREIQPTLNGATPPDGPLVWVGVMYVGKSGVDPGNDHIWGHGSVSSDPTSPTFFVAMWTTC